LQGIQGFIGVQGLQGLQGAQGVQGTQGLFGPATIPQNLQNVYVLQSSDNGKHILANGGNITVPASVFSSGENVVIVNNTSSSISIIEAPGVILRFSGTALTGNRTLVRYGVATILCTVGGGSPTFYISGSGLV
jgi:hypothetical protein